MESKISVQSPQVRIGVIQTIEAVELKVNAPAQVLAATGERLGTIEVATSHVFHCRETQPVPLRYSLRLAKAFDAAAAQKVLRELTQQKVPAKVIQVGEVFEFNAKTFDNREYWIVSGEFENEAAANHAANHFRQYEDQSPVLLPPPPPVGKIMWGQTPLDAVIRIVPDDLTQTLISVANVRVGIEFHWDHRETQDYRGVIEIRLNHSGQLTVINEIPIEAYLESVNSSEMTPDCPLELLKAQTVAARSTIFATMGKHHFGQPFHLCADDHCQCYRGTRYQQTISIEAVQACAGEVLTYQDQVCDARYSKICGGIIERYENVWENREVPYLASGIDGEFQIDYPLNTEAKARAFIDSSPDAYCNTDRYQLPKMLEYSNHLFRWRVTYSRAELEALLLQKTGVDLGELQDIRPLSRGDSGRLIFMELVGSRQTLKIGKELAIRRVLSKTHLYSSCFYVEKQAVDGKVTHFTLVGAGWGHGVGLCQVGATIMAQKGFDYRAILSHYYPHSRLVKFYATTAN